MLGVHGVVIHSVAQLARDGWSLSWAGALLASGAVALWSNWTVAPGGG